jgi:hypothetical protein
MKLRHPEIAAGVVPACRPGSVTSRLVVDPIKPNSCSWPSCGKISSSRWM